MLELLGMFLLELLNRLGSDILLAKELLFRVLLTGGIRWEKFLGKDNVESFFFSVSRLDFSYLKLLVTFLCVFIFNFGDPYFHFSKGKYPIL
jgi:hypothetical protein